MRYAGTVYEIDQSLIEGKKDRHLNQKGRQPPKGLTPCFIEFHSLAFIFSGLSLYFACSSFNLG